MDNNFLSYADAAGTVVVGKTISPHLAGVDPRTIDDILKLSHVINATISNCIIDGHGLQRENAIDMNRECDLVRVENCLLVEGQQNALTIKGGCRNIVIKDTVIEMVRNSKGHCDIELGNYSDQSDRKVSGVVLYNVTRSDGGIVRIRVINSEWPTIIGGNCHAYKPIWARWPFWNIYVWARKKGIL